MRLRTIAYLTNRHLIPNEDRCIYDDAMINALRFAYDSGHSIQSHTWAHKDLAQQSADTSTFSYLFDSA